MSILYYVCLFDASVAMRWYKAILPNDYKGHPTNLRKQHYNPSWAGPDNGYFWSDLIYVAVQR